MKTLDHPAGGGGGGTAPKEPKSTLLYEARKKIHPRSVEGFFNNWRWAIVWATQILYYGLPWITWNDRPALLFDLVSRKFYIFGVVLWPQDFIYLTGLLVISALALFLFTAVAGRLFCGYACPQTVYTEIFMWVEKKIEGERPKRIKLDAEPLNGRKMGLRAAKYAAWGAIALWTGFTFAGYFTPIKTLGQELITWELGPWQTFWIFFYAGFTLLQAGFMREQVCKYMCPYARFQSSMFDKDTMIVTYDVNRGEPRGARKKGTDYAAKGLGACVDCGVCVQVCPTGIDIRKGLQYECIGCGACVDGCNEVMDKVGYDRGLIRYTTTNAMAQNFSKQEMMRHVLRPRVLLYVGILAAVTIAIFASLMMRSPLKVNVIRDRGVMAREVDGNKIENVYRLQMINTDEMPHTYVIRAKGLGDVHVAGQDATAREATITLPPTVTQLLPLNLQVSLDSLSGEASRSGSHDIEIEVVSTDNPSIQVNEKAVFFLPRQ